MDLAAALDRCLLDGHGFEQLTARIPRDEADALVRAEELAPVVRDPATLELAERLGYEPRPETWE